MEVLFHHWHDGGIDRSKSINDLERRDATSVDSGSEVTGEGADHRLTIPQATILILWVVACLMLVLRYLHHRRRAEVGPVSEDEDIESLLRERDSPEEGDKCSDDATVTKLPRKLISNGGFHGNQEERNGGLQNEDDPREYDRNDPSSAAKSEINADIIGKEESGQQGAPFANDTNTSSSSEGKSLASSTKSGQSTFSSVKPPPSFDKFLLYAAGLGAILLYFFVCDVWKEWPAGERVYNRDQFMFLTLLMFLVAAAFTVRTCPDKLLNRDQTEEWKGWMQVMFIWYHYFKAAETYNLVRVYIACYVWMTGFGNFSFFWMRKDFSLWRMLKMLFRLNFLVTLVLAATNNSYMLYYICAMHTYWFFTVYVFMAAFRSWNENPARMAAKFVAFFVCNAVIFDTPFLHYFFKPLSFVLSYEGSMHEWEFRAGLDHYACFVGMLCAYNYPHYERWMNYLDKRHIDRRDKILTISIKAFVTGIILVLVVMWYREFMFREKYAYNHIHPYISWVPILAYIALRNMIPALRTRYLNFFAFLGKITLETYICQLHVFLQSNAKELIVYLPGYPLLNFALATAIYIFISYWLFEITTVFSAFLLPQSLRKVAINLGVGLVVCSLSACIALLFKEAHFI